MSHDNWQQDEARGDAREDAARSTAPELVRCDICEAAVLEDELDEDELCESCSVWLDTLTDALDPEPMDAA